MIDLGINVLLNMRRLKVQRDSLVLINQIFVSIGTLALKVLGVKKFSTAIGLASRDVPQSDDAKFFSESCNI